MGAIIEAILTQIFEVVLLVLVYVTGSVLISVFSLGHLHVGHNKDEPSAASDSEKTRGLQITYLADGNRYVADWVVCLLGALFWIGIVIVLVRLF